MDTSWRAVTGVLAILQRLPTCFNQSGFRRGIICFRIDISGPGYPRSPSCSHLLRCSCMCCRSLWPAGSGRRVSSSSRPRREHLSPSRACLHLRDSGSRLCRSYTCCKSRHTHAQLTSAIHTPKHVLISPNMLLKVRLISIVNRLEPGRGSASKLGLETIMFIISTSAQHYENSVIIYSPCHFTKGNESNIPDAFSYSIIS